jgi:hypothetical protein
MCLQTALLVSLLTFCPIAIVCLQFIPIKVLGILIVTLLISWKGPSTLARIKMAKEELDIKIKNAAAAGTQPNNASSSGDEGSAQNFCTDLSNSMYRMYLDVSVKRKGVVLLAVRCEPNKYISFCSLLPILPVPPPLFPSVCHI